MNFARSISRGWSILGGLCLSCGLLCALSCERSDQGAAAKIETPAKLPHVIFVSVDTLRADHLGCYGYDRPTSPNLDRLAAGGVRFAHAFTQASWTLPSHMSMFTSQYPHIHGVQEEENSLPEAATTLAEVLSDAGYQTAAIISWVFVGETFGFAQGFDRFDELLPPPHLVDPNTYAAYRAEHVTDHAIRVIQKTGDKPLFLFVHYFDPHINYEAPEPFNRMFDREYEGEASGNFGWLAQFIKGLHHEPNTINTRDLQYVTALYDGEICYTDAHLGRLFSAIDRTLDLDSCIIIFTSDHGEELNEHGSMEGHQWTLYEETLRVPLIVRMPGGAYAGRVVETPVEHIDIAATIAGVLGIDKPATFQGRDLSAMMSATVPRDEASLVFGEIRRFNRKQSVRGPRYKLIHTDDIGNNKRGVPVTPGYELFDLQTDPGEQHNIFKPDLPNATQLVAELDRFKQLTIDPQHMTVPQAAELSEADLKRLRSLGYVE